MLVGSLQLPARTFFATGNKKASSGPPVYISGVVPSIDRSPTLIPPLTGTMSARWFFRFKGFTRAGGVRRKPRRFHLLRYTSLTTTAPPRFASATPATPRHFTPELRSLSDSCPDFLWHRSQSSVTPIPSRRRRRRTDGGWPIYTPVTWSPLPRKPGILNWQQQTLKCVIGPEFICFFLLS